MLQLVDEEFDALEGFFYVLEHGILELLENVETYLLHLQVNRIYSTLCQQIRPPIRHFCFDMVKPNDYICVFRLLTHILYIFN